MSLWTRSNKPKWAPHAVAGKDGWVHPITNETLATFGTKPTIVATPAVQSVILYKNTLATSGDVLPDTRTTLKTGDYLYFAVRFNGQVTVVPDASVPSPYLTVTVGSNTRNAVYMETCFGNVGIVTLFFVYRITSTDVAVATGVSIGTLHLSGHIYKLGTTSEATLTPIPRTLVLSVTGVTLVSGKNGIKSGDLVSCVTGTAVGYVVDYNPTTSKLVVVETSGTFSTGTLLIIDTDNLVTMVTATLSATAAQLAVIAVN